jgi:hypothetical protein
MRPRALAALELASVDHGNGAFHKLSFDYHL